MRLGGVTGFGAAKALKPMDSNAGNVIKTEVLRRKWRRVFIQRLRQFLGDLIREMDEGWAILAPIVGFGIACEHDEITRDDASCISQYRSVQPVGSRSAFMTAAPAKALAVHRR